MRNRLTFPSAGMETKYVWDRYALQNNGIYIWDKHTYYDETRYYWDKYSTIQKTEFKWDKYSIVDGQKGEYIETITAVGFNSYPQSGIQGGYWYEYVVEGTWYWNKYGTKNQYIWNAYTPLRSKVKKVIATEYNAVQPYVKMSQSCRLCEEDGTVFLENIIIANDTPLITFYIYEDDGKISEKTVNLRSALQGFFENTINYGSFIDENSSCHFPFFKYNKIGFFKYDNQLYAIGADTSIYCDNISRPFNERIFDLQGAIKVQGYTTLPKPVSWIPYDGSIHSNDTGWQESSLHIYDIWHHVKDKNSVGTTRTYKFTSYETPNFEDCEMFMFSECNAYGTTEETDYLSTCFHRGQHATEIYENIKVTEWYYIGDTFLQEVTSESSTAFPKGNVANGIYYEYVGTRLIQDESNYIGVVTANSKDTYPYGGVEGSYYYEYDYFEDSRVTKDAYLETIYDLNRNAYPDDFYNGDYWYIYKESQIHPVIDAYIETVNAETINEYPKDGIKGGYWYVYQRYENNGPYKSRWVDEVETNNSASYPLDGIQGNYWYVYKKSYDGYKLQINDWQIKGGVNYKHNINPEKDFTIGCVASAEIDFDYDNTADDFQQYLDADYCDYWTWQPEDSDWRLIGRFWLTDAEYNRNLVKVKAFDAILAADAYVDEFIANTTYPISITNFFNNLCQLMGVTGRINSSLANRTFTFQDNFQAINITARQLLQYIAEATGGFIKVEPDGTLYLTTYSSSGKTLDKSNYTSYAKQRYTVEPISGLTVKMNSDDLGVSYGDVENNPYIIENNPLFYTESDQEIASAVYRLYNSINDKVYRPATIQLLQDFGINCGDIITINGDTFYVMSKELSASGCKLECFGNQYREKQPQSINSDIVALRGKTNELYRDLETTQSTLTDTANGLQSQITQTAEEINLRVTNEVSGLESKITQTAEEINLRVTNEVSGLESKITQTADSITSTVTDEINQAKSEIKQTTDSISLEVQNQGDLVAQLVLDVDGISARGYVTFTDLAGSGTTTINGDNITTGTISADRINMTGAISWGDLSSSCQDTIASFAGSDANVPDYIQNTYIDAVRIVSPTIQGGTLSAGTTAEGYMKMSSSGMDFKSDKGGNLMGIGFYPGRYNFPYIIFGDGVDSNGTDRGMIKKYSWGIWIGDNDGQQNDEPTGTGLMIDFAKGRLLKYVNGVSTVL